MPRFAANLTTLFADRPFAERFAAAADAGFKAVEFLFPYEHSPGSVASWLQAANLQQAMFNLPPGDWGKGERGLAALPGREAEFRRSVDTALRYARLLGAPRLHAMAGLSTGEAAEAVYVKNLRWAAEALATEGLELLIEVINGRDMPGYFLGSQDQAVCILEAVGAPNLKLQADLYHLQITGGDLTRTLQRDIVRIGHVQIAGVPDRHEPDEGELDYAHLFRLLDALGYNGWIGCEYFPRGRTEDGLDWRDRLL